MDTAALPEAINYSWLQEPNPSSQLSQILLSNRTVQQFQSWLTLWSVANNTDTEYSLYSTLHWMLLVQSQCTLLTVSAVADYSAAAVSVWPTSCDQPIGQSHSKWQHSADEVLFHHLQDRVKLSLIHTWMQDSTCQDEGQHTSYKGSTSRWIHHFLCTMLN